MKVIQVVESIANESAGPTYTVWRLSEALNRRGDDTVALYTLKPLPEKANAAPFPVVGFERFPVIKGLAITLDMWNRFSKADQVIDVVHSNGLWLMPNIYAAWGAKRLGAKLVVSPRGMLSGWALAHSARAKKLMWTLAQKRALLGASCLHATAESEYEDIRRAGIQCPVAIIPNGIDIPAALPMVVHEQRPMRRLLFLARIHKKKGVDVLLRSWERLQDRYQDWDLWIAGPDDRGYLKEMRAVTQNLGLRRVIFGGPAYGQAKSELFCSSDVYVLPTHSENFGLTIAEALAHGVPVITTHGAPWAGLTKYECGWWIANDEDRLVATLDEAMSSQPERLREMGKNGRAWMEREFSWSIVAEQMHLTYQWLLEGGVRPGWILLN